MEVNWVGIRRTSAALGGEGTNLLLLQTPQEHEAETLDLALEPLHESPANGGWFRGPTGWLLLIEGLDEQVDPWIDDLAARLAAAGIEGTLTGAGITRLPAWTRTTDGRTLHALFGLRTRPDARLHDGWLTSSATLDAAVEAAMDWLTAHDGEVVVTADLRADFRVPRTVAAQIMPAETGRLAHGFCSSYHKERREARSASFNSRAALTLSSASAEVPWRDTVAELRTALVSAPLAHISVAAVSHLDWGTLLGANVAGSEYYHRPAYESHPERWDEFTLDPCAIQVLTNRHLAAANDLTDWNSTRLDADHVLVEARDLDPWFETVVSPFDTAPQDVLDQARRDFGNMVLTHDQADALGLSIPPPPPY